MIKERWNALSISIQKFTKTIYFLIFISGLTLFSYFIDVTAVGYISFVVLLILLLVFNCDFSSIFSLIILWFGGSQNNSWVMPSPPFIIVLVLYSITLIIFIYKIIKNRKIYLKRLKMDHILYALILLFLSMLLSFINTPDFNLSLLGIGHFAIILFSYILVRMTVEPNEENKEFILKSIFITALVVSIQAIYMMFHLLNSGISFYEIINYKLMYIGWGHPNHYVAILNVASIMAFYYFTKHRESAFKRVIALILIFIYLFAGLLTASRAGYLAYVIALVIGLIIYCIYTFTINKKNRYKEIPYWTFIITMISLGLVLCYFTGLIESIITKMLEMGANFNGRGEIYLIAVEKFNEYTLFGAGVYTTHYYIQDVWNYHNYFFQMIGTCGILGTLAFFLYLYFSIKRSMKMNLYSIFTLVVILYFLIHGFYDTIYFHHYVMPLICILQAVEKTENINLYEIQYSDILDRKRIW